MAEVTDAGKWSEANPTQPNSMPSGVSFRPFTSNRRVPTRDFGCGRLCLVWLAFAVFSRKASGLAGENSEGDGADNL
jgi:hypothetical protein